MERTLHDRFSQLSFTNGSFPVDTLESDQPLVKRIKLLQREETIPEEGGTEEEPREEQKSEQERETVIVNNSTKNEAPNRDAPIPSTSGEGKALKSVLNAIESTLGEEKALDAALTMLKLAHQKPKVIRSCKEIHLAVTPEDFYIHSVRIAQGLAASTISYADISLVNVSRFAEGKKKYLESDTNNGYPIAYLVGTSPPMFMSTTYDPQLALYKITRLIHLLMPICPVDVIHVQYGLHNDYAASIFIIETHIPHVAFIHLHTSNMNWILDPYMTLDNCMLLNNPSAPNRLRFCKQNYVRGLDLARFDYVYFNGYKVHTKISSSQTTHNKWKKVIKLPSVKQ